MAAEASNTPINLEEVSDSDGSKSSDSEDQSEKTTAADAASAMKISKGKAKKAEPLLSKRKRERKAVQLRSKVWEHFNKFDEPIYAEVDGVNTHVGITKKAKCKYCMTILACDSRENGTSSLNKHIEVHCKVYPGSKGCLNVEDGKQHHLSSDLIEGFKQLSTRVWSQEACIDAATKMIVIDELPFSAIERKGFRYFCEIAIPRLVLPCRKTIVKNFLRMYEEKKMELKAQLKSVSVCLTTDTWTSCQNINYMVITAHFIDASWTLHKRVLKFCVIPNHSGITIGKILENALIEWGIERVLTISVDNASANKIAIDYVRRRIKGWAYKPLCEGNYLHVRCLPHIINLIVKSGLREMESSVAAIRNAIRFVRSSPARLQEFKKCMEMDKIESKKICILDVPTRWNSTYMMLDTAIELKIAFQRMADDDPLNYKSYFSEEEEFDYEEEETEARMPRRNRVGPPKDVDWDKAESFVKFLKVFFQVTVNLSASLEPTAHSAFHEIVSIKAELDDLTTSPPDVQDSEVNYILFDMAKKMTTKFNKYFCTLDDINPLFLVALVLDPRYKLKYLERVAEKMLLLEKSEVKRRANNLKDLLITICAHYGNIMGVGSSGKSVNSEASCSAGNEISSNKRSGKEKIICFGKRKAMLEDWEKQLEEGEEVVVGHEVDRYLLDPIEKPKSGAKFKITQWWMNNGSKYPLLQAIARDVLAIQVSTVASESSFSTGKRVIDSSRCSMTPKTVEALICF